MRYKVYFQENGILKQKELQNLQKIPPNTIKIEEIHLPLTKSFLDKKGDVTQLLYELNLMLEAKLPLKDVIEMLLQSHKNGLEKDILQTISDSLKNGHPIYKSLQTNNPNVGYLLILFFKLGEENSNLQGAIYSLYTILDENKKLQKTLLKSLQYPILLFISICLSIGVIFQSILPKFEHIFILFGDNLPLSTSILVGMKSLFYNHFGIIFGFLFTIVFGSIYFFMGHRYLFSKIFFFHIPYLSKLIRYLIFYKFFLSLFLIVHSKHKLQNALVYGKYTTNNLFFQEQIEKIIEDLKEGVSLSSAFSNRNCFDELTLRLLMIGESTNKIEDILKDLQQFHKKQFQTNIENFTTFLTPFLIFIFAGVTLWLVLAIMTPVWEMSNFIK